MPGDTELLSIRHLRKPSGRFLELGTGTGLSTAWTLEGMDSNSTLISLDNDETLLEIALMYLGKDDRLKLVLSDILPLSCPDLGLQIL